MASLSTCHLGLWLGWQILLNLVKSILFKVSLESKIPCMVALSRQTSIKSCNQSPNLQEVNVMSLSHDTLMALRNVTNFSAIQIVLSCTK